MENKKKFNIIRTQLYHSPCGDLILGSFGDKLCLCDWTIEKHRIAVDKRILQKAHIFNGNYGDEGVFH